MFARDQLRQILPLLRLAAVAPDLVHAEIGMGAVGQPDGRRRARHLLHGDAMLEIAEPGPAILLLDSDAMHPELADLRPQLARKLVAPVDFGGARRDLVARKGMNGLANRIRGFAEIEIEHPVRVGDHGRAASGASGVIERLRGPQPYSLKMGLSRAETTRKAGPPGGLWYTAGCGKLPLALAPATGCNSPKQPPSGTNHGAE